MTEQSLCIDRWLNKLSNCNFLNQVECEKSEMANVNEAANSYGNAVFILALPLEDIEEALDRFPKECISDYFHDGTGLIINFKRFNQAVQFASRSHMINISGLDYQISLAETSVTVHDIATYTKDIKNIMESHGFQNVVHFYPIEELEDEQSGSFKLLKDYRVILRIPELFAFFDSTQIFWNGLPFNVSFFCHFCRENGHRAFECKKYPCKIPLIFEQPHLRRQTEPGSSDPQRRKLTTAQSQERKNQRIASLTKELKRAIYKVVDDPERLITYLMDVRKNVKGKRKLQEITNSYVRDIHGLMRILEKVVKTYKFAILTKDEENDLNFLKNLIKRLQKVYFSRNEIN